MCDNLDQWERSTILNTGTVLDGTRTLNNKVSSPVLYQRNLLPLPGAPTDPRDATDNITMVVIGMTVATVAVACCKSDVGFQKHIEVKHRNGKYMGLAVH